MKAPTIRFLSASLSVSLALKQYWTGGKGWKYVPVITFAEAFQSHKSGKAAMAGLAQPYDQSKEHQDALVKQKYSLSSEGSHFHSLM